jgi:heat shock protein HslJ
MNKLLRILILTVALASPAIAQIVPLPGTQWGTGVAVDRRSVTFGEDGRVSGHAGCNTFTGSYTHTGVDLKIGPLATTRKMCGEMRMKQEQAWLDMLARTDSYRLSEDRLRLMDARNQEIISLTRRNYQ